MQNYIDLLKDVLANGVDKADRTSVGESRAVFGRMLRWDLSDGFPIITTRKVSLRIAFEETMFFLRGNTQTKLLEEKNINIWKGNTSREFLDSRGLQHLPEGDMGHGYGWLWRSWPGDNGSIDQVKNLLENIKKDPAGRRHIITGWNPAELDNAALPPCHMMHMYSVVGNKLNSCFVMRSNDVPFGLPYNIMGYALLNHIFAKHLGLCPGDLVYNGWDVHIYKNQIDMCNEQAQRAPRALPVLVIKKDLPTMQDILDLQFSDIELVGYNPHPDIAGKPDMAV